jgi:hypothetical protein
LTEIYPFTRHSEVFRFTRKSLMALRPGDSLQSRLDTDDRLKTAMINRLYRERDKEMKIMIREYSSGLMDMVSSNQRQIDEAVVFKMLLMSEEEREVANRKQQRKSPAVYRRDGDQSPMRGMRYELGENLFAKKLKMPFINLKMDNPE